MLELHAYLYISDLRGIKMPLWILLIDQFQESCRSIYPHKSIHVHRAKPNDSMNKGSVAQGLSGVRRGWVHKTPLSWEKKKRLCWCLQGFWWSLFWYRPHDQASQTATCLLIKGQTNVFPPTWQQSALFPKGQSCSYLSRAIICAWEQELRLISPSRNLTRHLWLQNSIDTRINYNSLL